jgi:hypothetical protein
MSRMPRSDDVFVDGPAKLAVGQELPLAGHVHVFLCFPSQFELSLDL